MAMTNFGTNDPLAVNLWSKSIDVEALKHTDIFPLTGDEATPVRLCPTPGRPKRTSEARNRVEREIVSRRHSRTLIMLPDDGAGGLQPLALPPPGVARRAGILVAHTTWENNGSKQTRIT